MKKQSLTLFVWAVCVGLISCQQGLNHGGESTKSQRAEKCEYGLPIDSFDVIKGCVKSGQTLSSILGELGCKDQIIHQLNKLSEEDFNAKHIRQGDTYSAFFSKNSAKEFTYFVYHHSLVNHTVFCLTDSLRLSSYKKAVRSERKFSTATIKTSLWDAIVDQQLNLQLALNLSDIYAWSIDFFGLQKNDSFAVIYEELYVDSTSVGIGNIYAATFVHKGKSFEAFYFKKDSVNGYWDENGNSLRKAFLKAPLKFSRVSSGFSYARRHPIHKTIRPHTGVDYAAPIGTPVMSIGDGVVIQKGYNGGGGHTIKIRHNSVYTTAYLHLSRYAKNINVGSHVVQGEVIGYVGSTGSSTGPHLDFRVWKNNSPINPLKMDSPSIEPIPENLMDEFATVRDSLKKVIR